MGSDSFKIRIDVIWRMLKFSFLGLILGSFLLISCNKDSPEVPPDAEKVLQEAGEDLPHDPKLPPPLDNSQGSGPEVLSSLPPEVDRDADGIADRRIPSRPDLPVDNCAAYYNPEQEDQNSNGIGDACE